MHGGFVGADEHAAAPQIAQLAHRRLSFLCEPHEALTVVLEHAARVGQRAAFRRAVEQVLTQVVLEAPDRLADRRLRAMDLGRGAGEAALLATARKIRRAARSINVDYCNVIIIALTSSPRLHNTGPMSEQDTVIIFDTTLRDGEQAPGFSMDVPAKLKMARRSTRLEWTSSRRGSPSHRPLTPRRRDRSRLRLDGR